MSCQPPNFPSPIHFFFLYAWVLSRQMYACMHLCIHSFTHALRVSYKIVFSAHCKGTTESNGIPQIVILIQQISEDNVHAFKHQ